MEQKKVRFNIYLSVELKEYLFQQAEMIGVSASSLVNMIIAENRKQAQTLDMYSNLEKLVKEISKEKEKK